MKTISILITFLISINLVICQPVVNSDILLTIGDERDVSYVETAFNPGEAGENITWDFSSLTESYSVTWFAISPEETGLGNLFPTADIAFNIPGDEGSENYTEGWTFYDTGSGDEISLLGSVILNVIGTNVDSNFFFLNDDPDLLFEFPMTYPDQFSDDISGTAVVFFQGQQFELERSGSTTTEVDGYGTLITPEGTYTNVLRVKRTEELTDMFLGIPTNHEIVRYDWFSPIYDYLLYHTEEIIIRDAGGAEQSRTTQTYYAEPQLITAVPENKVESFNVYPNPSSKFIRLPQELLGLSAKVEIYSMHGKSVFAKESFSDKIDVSHFSPGVYFVSVTENNGKRYRSQFVVN